MFIPRAAFSSFRVMCGNFVIVLFAAFSIVTRPFSDRFEDYMEILSQLANSTNILVALGLSSDTISESIADGILLVINGLAVAMFILSIIVSPFQYCRNVYSFRAAKEIAARQARDFARVASLDSPNVLSAANLHEVGDAAKAVGQQGVEMASRVITLASDHDELRRGLSTVRHGAAYVVDNRSALAAGAYSGVASAAAYAADNHGDWASQAANGAAVGAAAVANVANDISPDGVAAVSSAAQHVNDGAHVAANGVASAASSVGAAIGVDNDDIKRAAVDVKEVALEVKDQAGAGANVAAAALADVAGQAPLLSASEIKAAAEQSEAAAIAALSFVADSDIVADGKDALHDIGAQAMMIMEDGKDAASQFVSIVASDSFNDFSEEAANEWVDRASSAVSSAASSAAAAIGVAVGESKEMLSSSGVSSSAGGASSGMASSASGAASQASSGIQSGLQTASDALHSAGVALQSVSRDDILQFQANLGGNISDAASYAVNNAGEAKRLGIAGASYVAQQLPGVGTNIVNAYQSSSAAIGVGISNLSSVNASGPSQDQVSRMDQAQGVAVDALRTAAIATRDGAVYAYDHRNDIANGVSSGVRTAANVTSNVANDAVTAARNVDLGATGNAIASGAASAATTVAGVATNVASRIDTDDIKRAALSGANAVRSVGAAGIAVAGDVDWRGAGNAIVTTGASVGSAGISAASHVDLSGVGNAASSGAAAVGAVGTAGMGVIRNNVDISGARNAISSGVTSVVDEAKSAIEFAQEHKQQIMIGRSTLTLHPPFIPHYES
jgi:Na+-transporting methylmalonyl-CoA/oxaloacetate decarboxylase gamma subunit